MYGGQSFGTRNSENTNITLYLRAISKCKPPGAYIGRGDLT